MALKAEVQGIAQSLPGSPAFFYGTEDEFNVWCDSADLKNGVFFMYSLQQVGFEVNLTNSISNKYSLFVAMLYKIEFDGVDSNQAEPFDTQAINALNAFIIGLKNYRGANGGKMFRFKKGDKAKQRPVYFNYADVNLYGRSMAIDAPTIYNDGYCNRFPTT